MKFINTVDGLVNLNHIVNIKSEFAYEGSSNEMNYLYLIDTKGYKYLYSTSSCAKKIFEKEVEIEDRLISYGFFSR